MQQLKGNVSLEIADQDDDDDLMLEEVKATKGAGSAFGEAKKNEAQKKRMEERAAARADRDAVYHLKADKVHMVGSRTRKAVQDGSKYYTLYGNSVVFFSFVFIPIFQSPKTVCLSALSMLPVHFLFVPV